MPRVVVVDTNVWVSAFLTPRGHPAQLKIHWQANRFDVVVSVQLLTELAEVLARPRLQSKYRYSSDKVADYLRLIAELSDLVTTTGTLRICRDPDDDVLLETASASHATHIISRDEDVTRDAGLTQYLKAQNIQAVTVQRFLDELRMG